MSASQQRDGDASLYLSYTYLDPVRLFVPKIVEILGARGIRVFADISWTMAQQADPEVTVRDQCAQAAWRVAVFSRNYLARSTEPAAGVRTDLRSIAAEFIARPKSLLRNAVIVDNPSLVAQLPLELQGSRWTVAPQSSPEVLVGAIEAILAGRTEPSELGTAHPSSLARWAQLASRTAGGSAAQQTRPSGPVWIGTILLALVAEPSVLGEMLGRIVYPDAARRRVSEGPRSSEKVQSAPQILHWAAVASRLLNLTDVNNLLVLGGLLHRDAPWTEPVENLLRSIDADPERLRDEVLGYASARASEEETVLLAGAFGRREQDRAVVSPEPEPLRVTKAPTPPRQPSPSSPPPKSALSNLAQPDRGYARLDPDLAYGKDDQLDITGDVEALAKMIAAWKLEPPLAIGLFGDWGSGKTFFMNKLREKVADLSGNARKRDHTLQKDEAYCKYIAQVEFNAWHYSEGDLWAGMVHHIFANLKIDLEEPKSKIAERQEQTLAALKAAEGVEAEKAEKFRLSTQAAAVAVEAKADAEKKAEVAVTNLAVSVKDAITMLREDKDVQAAAGKALQNAAITPDTIKAAKEVQTALKNVKNGGANLFRVGKQLATDLKERPVRTGLWYLAVFGIVVLIYFIADLGALKDIGAWIRWTVGLVLAAIPVIGTLLNALNRAAELIEEPRRRIAEDFQKRILEAQEAVNRTKADASSARAELQSAVAKVAVARAEVERANPAHILSDFLSERAGSKDYRDKLGMLAMVRGDFDRLSTLMMEQKKKDEADTQARKPQAGQLCLNRIILYIDDLDRCEPDRVVKVLQAVHLLLAFPLFVVVVGVDARWVQRSLKKEYKLLLRGEVQDIDRDGDPDNDDTDDEAIASPRDYLEKIFQIPLWLPKLTETTQKKLIRSLIDSDLPATAEPRRNSAPPTNIVRPTSNINDPASRGDTGDTTNISGATPRHAKQPNAAPLPPANNSGNTIKPDVVSAGDAKPDTQPDTKPDAPPEGPETLEHLKLDPDEIETMERFAVLCGRSPRAIKRYVNCYRLFKAMLRQTGDSLYVADAEPGQAPYELALLMLAMVVGTPLTAYKFIELLRNPANHARTFDEALLSLDPAQAPTEPADREVEEWSTLTRYLGSASATPLPNHVLGEDTQQLLFRIWRFSFRSGESLGRKVPRRPPPPEDASPPPAEE